MVQARLDVAQRAMLQRRGADDADAVVAALEARKLVLTHLQITHGARSRWRHRDERCADFTAAADVAHAQKKKDELDADARGAEMEIAAQQQLDEEEAKQRAAADAAVLAAANTRDGAVTRHEEVEAVSWRPRRTRCAAPCGVARRNHARVIGAPRGAGVAGGRQVFAGNSAGSDARCRRDSSERDPGCGAFVP